MRYKYPRTPHLPFSDGVNDDDKIIKSMDNFLGRRIIITEKMDGENTTIGSTYSHARSIDSRYHPSRSLIKALQSEIGYLLPDSIRICGENLYAKHSIAYSNLPKNMFLAFSIWDGNKCLSWDRTTDMLIGFGIEYVRVIYDGMYDADIFKSISNFNKDTMEGYVVRVADEFNISKFDISVAKYVRKNHVQSDSHWMNQEIVRNSIRG